MRPFNKNRDNIKRKILTSLLNFEVLLTIEDAHFGIYYSFYCPSRL